MPACYITRAKNGREQTETKQYAEDQRAGGEEEIQK